MRLFAIYLVATLVPVVALGFVLIHGYQTEATSRGLTQARSEAAVLTGAVAEPLVNGQSLKAGLGGDAGADLREITANLVEDRQVLRLRLHDTTGRVVFSSDNSGSPRESMTRSPTR